MDLSPLYNSAVDGYFNQVRQNGRTSQSVNDPIMDKAWDHEIITEKYRFMGWDGREYGIMGSLFREYGIIGWDNDGMG